MQKTCTIKDCGKLGLIVKGMCNAHYLKARKYGDALYVAKPPPPPGMKLCCQCRETLPRDDFNRLTASKDGLYPSCRSCVNGRKRQQYADDPESGRARLRASYLRRRETVAEQSRAARASRDVEDTRHKFRARHLKRKFGITPNDFDRLMETQEGRCGACNQPEVDVDGRTGRLRYLAIDHCHDTGVIRGLLCRRCNTALGLLGDDAQGVKRLLTYLE